MHFTLHEKTRDHVRMMMLERRSPGPTLIQHLMLFGIETPGDAGPTFGQRLNVFTGY